MTDLLFYGDPHGEFRPLVEAVDLNPPEAVFLLGDMEAAKPLDEILAPVLSANIPVHWVAGNHDTDTSEVYDHLFKSALAPINLHGRVVNVCGIKVAGLGGVFRGKVWNPDKTHHVGYHSANDMAEHLPPQYLWRKGPPLRHRSTIFPADFQQLLGQRADILICHEAPESHKYGSKAIGTLAGCLYAKHIVYGHLHVDYEKPLVGGVDVRGVGLRSLYRLNVEAFMAQHGSSIFL